MAGYAKDELEYMNPEGSVEETVEESTTTEDEETVEESTTTEDEE